MNANHPLRAWRQSKGLTLQQVGRLLDIDTVTVSNYENGRRVPRPHIMARIESVTLRAVTASDFLPSALSGASPDGFGRAPDASAEPPSLAAPGSAEAPSHEVRAP